MIFIRKLSDRNKFRLIWFSMVASFFIWQWSTYQAKGIHERFLEDTKDITVTETEHIISIQHISSPTIEILFYPGGLVDPKSYVPLARKVAESGYNVYIIKMPFRMSINGYQKIKDLFNLSDPEKIYILGGHSQGGKMAAQFVYENRKVISGLYLLGTSHPRDINMSDLFVPTIKVFAEYDGLASIEEVKENQHKLPQDTRLFLIKGGNHSQFGYFGTLFMDGKATISRKDQHLQTVKLLTEFFASFK